MLYIESKHPVGIRVPLGVKNLEFCNIVNMCIKERGHYMYRIPENYYNIVDVLLDGVHKLDDLIAYSPDYNVYLTMKKMYINPNTIGNRPDWHIDGFLSDQRNFIWSDCDATPTEVLVSDLVLTPDHAISIEEMTEQSVNGFKVQLKTGMLYYMDQECVHRPTYNNTNEAVLRTFIKLTFTKEDFNAIGNAWNYKLPHIVPTEQRKDTRNHGVIY